ncbi:MALE GAMETOPHYTE DEFECTIVE 2 [Perilla frutescens var. hirtella]|uniref:MALE GAMETOPHYTE DEFECTIVE 2 n=1 Tax=Perilla frutescens var. hirtella TaxID=608512 RepID=A0AAD4IY41_PERFH|nr:MALE GAMETOPHYTE DEFECTIVE 2 [Perilla frutescens var. hirtella]
MRGLKKPSIRRPALLHLLCAAAILSLFVFALKSSFPAAGNLQISKINRLDVRILSDFQSTVQQCVANRGLGLTAQIIDHCNLILKFPEGTNSTWYNEQFKIFEPLEYKYDVCEAILLWEQYRNMTTVLTREYLDARPDGWLEYAPKRIAQLGADKCYNKTLCEEHLNILLPAKPPFHPRQFRTCAVVGNSGDLLKTEFGEEIDSHDAVIRDNEAPVNEKYAKYVGLKRDFRLVVRGAARNMIPILNGSDDEVLIIKSLTHRSFNDMIKMIPNPVYLFQGIVLRRGAKGTGMKSIELALSMCDIVDIYGFTVDPGYSEWTRYFSTPRKGHNPLQGRAYYQVLECLGVIRIHSPMRAARKQDWSDVPSRETMSRAHSAAVRLKKSQDEQDNGSGQFRNCKVWGNAGPYGSGPVSGWPDMSDVRKNSNYRKWEVMPYEKLSEAARDHYTQMEGVSMYKMDDSLVDKARDISYMVGCALMEQDNSALALSTTTPSAALLISFSSPPRYLAISNAPRFASVRSNGLSVNYNSTFSVFPAEACDTIGGDTCAADMHPEVKPQTEARKPSIGSEAFERQYLDYTDPKTVLLGEACDVLGGEFCDHQYQKGIYANNDS